MKTLFRILLFMSILLISCNRQPVNNEEESNEEEEVITGHVVLKIDNTTVFDEHNSEEVYWSQTEDAVLFQFKENNMVKLGGAIEHVPPVNGSFVIAPQDPEDNESLLSLTSETHDLQAPDGRIIYFIWAQSGTVYHTSDKNFHVEGRCRIYSDGPDYGEYDFELDISVAQIF